MTEVLDFIANAPGAAVLALSIMPIVIGESVIGIQHWIEKHKKDDYE